MPALAVASEDGETPLGWLPTEPVILGGIALTLSYGAYVAEVYRAGINSVHRGQRDAALAVGLTEAQALRHVIVPQAVRDVGPPLLNDFIALQKDVALIAIIGVTGEAFRQAQIDHRLDLQLHAARGRRAALPVHHDPDGAPARPLGAAEGRPVSKAVLELTGRDQVLRGASRFCMGSTSLSREHRPSR